MNNRNQTDADKYSEGLQLGKEEEEKYPEEPVPEREEEEISPPVPADLNLAQRYMREVRRYPLLTPEEEKILAIRYKETGDREAGQRLITSNLRLVIKIAFEFQRYWMKNFLDLIQEGNIGLLQAIKKFDPYRGVKLSYYATFWIRAYILRFIMENWRLVKIGTTQTQRKLFYQLNREKEKLRALGFEPGPKLLAEALHVKEKEVIEIDQWLRGWEVSLEAPLAEGTEEYLKKILPTFESQVEEVLQQSELKKLLRQKLEEFRRGLTEKEREILEQRLLAEEPLTLQEIGARYHISRERVRQIEDRMIKRLRQFVKKEIPNLLNNRAPMID